MGSLRREQPRSSQDMPTFEFPLDIESLFTSNPPSPSSAPEGDSVVTASASETSSSTPTHVPRWLQELMDADTVDSNARPRTQKRDKDKVSSGNSPADGKKPIHDVSAPVAPSPSTSSVYHGLSCNAMVSGSATLQIKLEDAQKEIAALKLANKEQDAAIAALQARARPTRAQDLGDQGAAVLTHFA